MTRIVSVTRSFTFDASHQLPWHDGPCSRLHGHTYRFEVTVSGPLNSNGIVVDFSTIKEIVQSKVLATLDHSHLNDTIENPTAENIAMWILSEIGGAGLDVSRIRVWETADSSAEISK